jgi:terminase large subunit-like protein
VSRYVVTAGWDDSPHLDDKAKADLAESIPADQLEARRNGTPALGSGKIYHVPEDEFRIAPFRIPPHFKQAYGLDVGIVRTAAVFGAWDEDEDVLYLHSLHYAADAIAAIHADAIQARGKWLRGVIDPAARGRNAVDGERLIEVYGRLGLDLRPADNAVSAGIYAVNGRLVSGRLKVFASLSEWFAEYKLYRRQDGKVVKLKDHAMDATRYLEMSGRDVARCAPLPPAQDRRGGSKWSG